MPPTHLGRTSALQPSSGQCPLPPQTHTVMGGRAGLLTVPELTYFFFFIFFLGFITYREKQLLFESIQGRFGAPTSPGCGLGTGLAGYGV